MRQHENMKVQFRLITNYGLSFFFVTPNQRILRASNNFDPIVNRITIVVN
jgi:hypothetical protein